MNRKKKKLYYENKMEACGTNNRRIWSTLNELMGKNKKTIACYLEKDNPFLVKPIQIANHLNRYFINKIDSLRCNMQVNVNNSIPSILNKIMNGKDCKFILKKVNIEEVTKALESCKERSSGVDQLDGTLMRPIAKCIAPVVCHIINRSFETGSVPQKWKIAKIIPLPKIINNHSQI